VCEAAQACTAPAQGGSAGTDDPTRTGGGAGAMPAAEGGAAGVLDGASEQAGTDGGDFVACVLPRADCDGSAFTVCETDVSFAASHCGGCNRECTGLCRRGKCIEPETLFSGAAAALDRDSLFRVGSAWYALLSSAGGITLESLDASGRRSVRLRSSSAIDAVKPGADRIYLHQQDAWWGMGLSTGEPTREQVPAQDLLYSEGALYWVEDGRRVLSKDVLSGVVTEQCTLPEATFSVETVSLANEDRAGLVVFRTGGSLLEQDSAHSEVLDCPFGGDHEKLPVQATILASGKIQYLRGRTTADFAYWDEQASVVKVAISAQRTWLVYRTSSPDEEIVDFVAHDRHLFVSSGTYGQLDGGLTVIRTLDVSQTERIGMLESPRSLVVDPEAGRLCYSDRRSQRIACVALELITD
jgi:hypothetical protein